MNKNVTQILIADVCCMYIAGDITARVAMNLINKYITYADVVIELSSSMGKIISAINKEGEKYGKK